MEVLRNSCFCPSVCKRRDGHQGSHFGLETIYLEGNPNGHKRGDGCSTDIQGDITEMLTVTKLGKGGNWDDSHEIPWRTLL